MLLDEITSFLKNDNRLEIFRSKNYGTKLTYLKFFLKHCQTKNFKHWMKEFQEIKTNDMIYLFKMAVCNCNIPIIKYFLDKRIDISADNHFAIKTACLNNMPELLNFLIKRGADPCAENNYPIMHTSNYKIIEILMEHGADIHASDDHLFRRCVKFGNYDLVEILMSLGVNINANNGESLKLAILFGNEKITELLLKNGANLNVIGYVDIINIIRMRKYNMIRLLLSYGFDLSQSKFEFCDKKVYTELTDIINLMTEFDINLPEFTKMLLLLVHEAGEYESHDVESIFSVLDPGSHISSDNNNDSD